MSHGDAAHSRRVVAPMEHCWRIVGVSGDRSCPELSEFVHCRNCPVLAAAARRFFDRPPPEGYLASWQEILEKPVDSVAVDARSVLVFRLGDEWLALPTSVLVEVTAIRPVHRLPHRSGTVLAGVTNVRGQLQLCVRLGGLLGLSEAVAERSAGEPTARLLVIERTAARGPERWACAVDEVAGIQLIPKAALRHAPATVRGTVMRATTALFSWEGRTVGLLDEGRLLDGLSGMIAG